MVIRMSVSMTQTGAASSIWHPPAENTVGSSGPWFMLPSSRLLLQLITSRSLCMLILFYTSATSTNWRLRHFTCWHSECQVDPFKWTQPKFPTGCHNSAPGQTQPWPWQTSLFTMIWFLRQRLSFSVHSRLSRTTTWTLNYTVTGDWWWSRKSLLNLNPDSFWLPRLHFEPGAFTIPNTMSLPWWNEIEHSVNKIKK
jgi:hypothetical protein